jgi:hypothetical protein
VAEGGAVDRDAAIVTAPAVGCEATSESVDPVTARTRHRRGGGDTAACAEDIRRYIAALMATRPEPRPQQIQQVRDLLPPA